MVNSNAAIMNGLRAGLFKAANLFVAEVTKKLQSGNYPSGDSERGLIPIQDSIVIGEPEISKHQSSIIISIGNKSAPYARAYEYGSGEHTEESQAAKKLYGDIGQGKYDIKPVNAKYLFFPFAIQAMPRRSKLAGVKGIGGYDAVARMFKESAHGQISGDMFWNYVEHPGVEAKPYIFPTIEKTKKDTRRLLSSAFKVSILNGVPKVIEINVP